MLFTISSFPGKTADWEFESDLGVPDLGFNPSYGKPRFRIMLMGHIEADI